jgi:hypothetical protein
LALVGALPTLSWIEAFNTEPLTAAAPRWNATAELWEQSFAQLGSDVLRPGGTDWTGDGAEAAQDSADRAAMTARGASNKLRDAAEVATLGADQLDGLHAKALAAIAEASGDGFQINEDLSVTDTHRNPWGSSAYAARQAKAVEHAESIQSYAGQLLALDSQYASKLEAATAGLDTLRLDAPGGETPSTNGHNGIHLVGNHTWKDGPAPGNGPEPPPNPQQPRVRGLPPPGVSPPVAGDLTPGPASRPSEVRKGGQSLWDENGGEWRYFPGDQYHNPHWDFNPHKNPNEPWENVPIGGLPPVKDNSIITGLPPWLQDAPAVPGVLGPPQNPFLAPFPGAEMPTPAPLPSAGPIDIFPHVDIPAPSPSDLENAGATGTGVVAGGGLLALLSMLFVQN